MGGIRPGRNKGRRTVTGRRKLSRHRRFLQALEEANCEYGRVFRHLAKCDRWGRPG